MCHVWHAARKPTAGRARQRRLASLSMVAVPDGACVALQHGWRFALQLYPAGCPAKVCGRRQQGLADLQAPDDSPHCSVPACAPRFNDSSWLLRSVPHDFSTERAPSLEDSISTLRAWSWARSNRSSTEKKEPKKVMSAIAARHSAQMAGSLPIGHAWYRRTVMLPPAAMHWLEFDGVMAEAVVFVEGRRVGQHVGGYLPFVLPLDVSSAQAGARVQVSVFVDGSRPHTHTWWADGAGLVRQVRICGSSSALRIGIPPAGEGVRLSTQFLEAVDSPHEAPRRQQPQRASSASSAMITITTPVTFVAPATGDGPARPGTASQEVAWFRVHTRLIHLGSAVRREAFVRSRAPPRRGATAPALGNLTMPLALKPGEATTVTQTVLLPNARLWSVEAPHLYECHVALVPHTNGDGDGDGGHSYTHEAPTSSTPPFDEVRIVTGVRQLEWSRAHGGLLLNGQRVALHGVANHEDFAGVGTAIPDALQWWRVQAMKDIGANAWRTAHNPPTRALLDAADALGLLVILENDALGAGPSRLERLRTLVLRDRHHPCVVAYSLCNEGLCREPDDHEADFANSVGASLRMQQLIRELDSDHGGRAVTAAINRGFGGTFERSFERLIGYNYHHSDYARHAWRTSAAAQRASSEQVLYASEVSSAFGDRAEYPSSALAAQPAQYLPATGEFVPAWGSSWAEGWCAVMAAFEKKKLAGGFAWSGFDYRGEPFGWHSTAGPSTTVDAVANISGAWPFVLSRFGLLDYAGFQKDGAGFFRAMARRFDAQASDISARLADGTQPHVLHLSPSIWNWPEGSTVRVQAYSSALVVELKLNGRSLGKKKASACKPPEWSVPFVRGSLTAIAYAAPDQDYLSIGRAVASMRLRTAGAPAALAVTVEYPRGALPTLLRAESDDVAVLRVSVLDAVGELVPHDAVGLHVSLKGPGRLLTLANGDPASHELDRPATAYNGVRSTWHGLLRVVVQAGGHAGMITVRIRSGAGTALNAAANVSIGVTAASS